MKRKADSIRRIAARVLLGAEAMSVEARIQLFEDVAVILPKAESEEALHLAFVLRESQKQQSDFLAKLQ